MIVDLTIRNKTANKTSLLELYEYDVSEVVEWYSAFYAGDDYEVIVAGVTQELDHNGQIKGKVKL